MQVLDTGISGLLLIKPQVFGDSRGYFLESFNKKKFTDVTGVTDDFVQDNQSLSRKDVVRGLHFQKPPYAQGKLVRVLQGSVLDVALDIRPNSPTYGKWFAVELSASNHLQLYVPKGFAHGFSTLQDDTLFAYKCTDYYNKESEDCILWSDPQLVIDWQVKEPVISEKDQQGKLFADFVSPF